MKKIFDIQLTPEVIKTIKQTVEGQSIILYNCTWSMEAVGNSEQIEEGYTILSFEKAVAIDPPANNENKE